MTPKELYSEMFKVSLAPALRALGLTGSVPQFVLPSDVCWAGVGFQRESKYTTPTTTGFTVNLSVVRKDVWQRVRTAPPPGLPARPDPNVSYALEGLGREALWMRRLGQVMPQPRDRWWRLVVGEPYEPVTVEILAALRDYGIPALQAQIADFAVQIPPDGGV